MGNGSSLGINPDTIKKNLNPFGLEPNEVQPHVISSPSLMSYNLQIALIIVCILLVLSTIYLYNKKC